MGLINVVKHYLNKPFLKNFLLTFLNMNTKLFFKKILFTLFNMNTSFNKLSVFKKIFINFFINFFKHEYKFLIRYPF